VHTWRQRRGKKKIPRGALSYRKHTNTPKRGTNLHDFQKDVLGRNVYKYYDR
jgi:hypothetical protein